MKHYSFILVLLIAHTVSVNRWLQSNIGDINLVLVVVLVISTQKRYKIEMPMLLAIGIIQDLLTMMPIGWHVAQILIAFFVLEKLNKFYLSINLRNHLVKLVLILAVVQLVIVVNFTITGRPLLLDQHLLNWLYTIVFSLIISFIARRRSLSTASPTARKV